MDISSFLRDEDRVVFVPHQQNDSQREEWLSLAERNDLGYRTIYLSKTFMICGRHHYPINKLVSNKCSSPYHRKGRCYVDNFMVTRKMGVVVLFKDEVRDEMSGEVGKVKDYLLRQGVIQINQWGSY